MNMEVRTLISEEEYLHMSFEDRTPEYVDGELVERTMPNNSHSKAQGEVVFVFRKLQERLPLYPRPELRVPVAPRTYRIVDLAVYAHQEPTELVPPQVMKRLEEYRAWGVRHVWLVDPGLRRTYVYSESGLVPVAAFELPEFEVRIPSEEILR